VEYLVMIRWFMRLFRKREILSNAPVEPWEGEQWAGKCGICGEMPCNYHGHYPVPGGEA
jgi:hypothetical protein